MLVLQEQALLKVCNSTSLKWFVSALAWDSTKQVLALSTSKKLRGIGISIDVLVSAGTMAFGICTGENLCEIVRHIIRPCVRLVSLSGESQYNGLYNTAALSGA